MMWLAFLIVLCLSVLGYYLVRDVFSPMFLQPAVWVFVIGMYFVAQPNFYPIQGNFPTALVTWSVTFCMASLSSYYLIPEKRGLFSADAGVMMGRYKPSNTLLFVYFLVSAVTIPVMLFILIKTAIDRMDENIMMFLRMSVVDESLDRPNFGIADYAMPIPLVLLVLLLMYSKNKWFVLVAVLLNFAVAALTMSKTGFLVVLIAVIYVLYVKKKIKLRSIITSFLLFAVFCVVFQYMRGSGDKQDNFSTSDFFSLYTLSPMVAFDHYVEPASSPHVGETVFRFYYAVAHSLGDEVAPVDNILPYVSVPDLTNTYTILYPFYRDFGLVGVGVFGFLYGVFFTFLYKRAAAGNHYYQVLYACFLSYLFVQFIQENIFSNLSLNIQYVFFIAVAYFFFKREDEEEVAPKNISHPIKKQ